LGLAFQCDKSRSQWQWILFNGFRNDKNMKDLLTGLRMIGAFALLVAGFSSCASTEVQKSRAEKEREAWYSNYVDKTDKVWSEHL
jgi:hypothetical protein